ncbi:MAG: sulfurtransferase TusA family protein [Candidatus Magnetobacterium sp. LHC-1]|uniref:Sulfurtransferase TusA family protein n=1 Tax=Candidatus Magnetobacterium casense TaxID=1455061 RepID=A0ABS6RWM3_9BACT|nr:sulfurtransferase TusA family protein [Candidatus Magnetobacterium casensis]MBF0338763.1 sulfurtransferase TusA family protein [Nitrospirota bacterium]MBF0608688.1 sulfurtransferase TusA family protein [Nitrospirota bacterium]MBV6340837.1 sulfurtransferase TusA family protein [Candidatus Magnetobacterium casensis]
MSDIKADQVLDTKGLNCPMPVLKTKKALDGIESGKVLEVISTDPGSKSDIPALLSRLGHELLETKESGNAISFFIKKA